MIKVVTDSVASLPQDILDSSDVEVVTLFLREGDVEHEDATMDLDDFYTRIYDMADNPPKSSQPAQSTLIDLFERIASDGDEVLGIWISSGLSGSINGVLQAARIVESHNLDFKYCMIDSSSCGGDEGFPVMAGIKAVKEGATLRQAADAVLRSILCTRFVFAPESLTFLQKGGRIGGAAALLGNALRLSPILTVVDGVPQTMAKVRTTKKAMAKMVSILEEDIEKCGGLKNLVVHYIGDKKPAVEWAKNVFEPLLGQPVRVAPVSPVVGMHVGPAVGLAYECNLPLPGKITGDVTRLAYAN